MSRTVEHQLDATFKALSDPTRRGMLASLALGDKSVGELGEPFAMTFAGAAKHVKVLESAGLIERRKAGRRTDLRAQGGTACGGRAPGCGNGSNSGSTRLDRLQAARRKPSQGEMKWLNPHRSKSRAPIERIAPDTIRLERSLDAPVETVWRYLTEGELRKEWFMGGTDARADSEFELLNDHDNLSDDDVPYPEDYARLQREELEREASSGSSRRGSSKPPSRAARTAR